MKSAALAKPLAVVVAGLIGTSFPGPAAASLMPGQAKPIVAASSLVPAAHRPHYWFWRGGWKRYGPWADHEPLFGPRPVPIIALPLERR